MSSLYYLYGVLLVVVFLAIIIYFYAPKRKIEVEEAKFAMLSDDDVDSQPDSEK